MLTKEFNTKNILDKVQQVDKHAQYIENNTKVIDQI